MQLFKLSMVYALIAASTILGSSNKVETNLESNLDSEESVSTLIRVCDISKTFFGTTGSCAPNSIPIKIKDDCSGVIKATVSAVNLKHNPKLNKNYPLLPGMSPIYLEYGIKNGLKFSFGPITQLAFRGNYAKDAAGNDYPIFEKSKILTIDVSELCPAGGSPWANISAEITVLDDNFNIYPVDDFAGIDEAFYCEIFQETCDQCAACSAGFDPYYEVNLCGFCNGCEVLEANNSSDDNNIPNNNFLASNEEVGVAPNPFDNEITIDVPVSLEKSYISVIDMTGKKLIQKEVAGQKYETKLTLNTQELPAGIYILHIQSGKSISSQHIMKTK